MVAYAGSGVSPAELEIIERLKERHIKAYLALNKIDLIENKEELLGRIAEYSALFEFEAVIPISALTGDGVDTLLDYMLKEAKSGPHYFADDALTDQPEAEQVTCPDCGTRHSPLIGCPSCAVRQAGLGRTFPQEEKQSTSKRSKKVPWEK